MNSKGRNCGIYINIYGSIDIETMANDRNVNRMADFTEIKYMKLCLNKFSAHEN